MNENFKIINGNSLEVLDTLEENSVDAIVTDPPYELGFMGKKWDNTGIAYNVELWTKALRVLKPGGYLLAFGAPRNYHRMAVAIEDAGFEIRDCIMWCFGSGFPKSQNVGVMVDKLLGQESEVIGVGKSGSAETHTRCMNSITEGGNEVFGGEYEIKKANNEWDGYGTCLKPAYEPIVMARKPTDLNYAENVLTYHCGALNIGECRVGSETINIHNAPKGTFAGGERDRGSDTDSYHDSVGRFPANFIHDGSDEVEACFPEGCPTGTRSQESINNCIESRKLKKGNSQCDIGGNIDHITEYTDKGSTSRFFYCAKASSQDRDEGLEKENPHVTVKPCALMKYLVRLVTPRGGTVLDIFNGSGSTGKAVAYENRERDANYKYIGIELDPEYCEISKARIEYALGGYVYAVEQPEYKGKTYRSGEHEQLSLFDCCEEEENEE